MNRKEAANLLPIIQAFLEGRTIERKTRSWELNKGWHDVTQWEETEELICRDTFVYRIKPESKYRPFANAEECWKEMQKHQPLGWVKNKDGSTINKFMFIDSLANDGVTIRASIRLTYSELVKYYIFADGTPLGVKVEE